MYRIYMYRKIIKEDSVNENKTISAFAMSIISIYVCITIKPEKPIERRIK